MTLELKVPNAGWPRDGWAFKDPRTGRSFNGMERDAEGQVTEIIKHRAANPRVYSPSEGQWFDRASVKQELYAQIHARLPELFIGFEAVQKYKAPPAPRSSITIPNSKCVCGATEVEPVYCQSCGGGRVSSYKCKSCGKERKP